VKVHPRRLVVALYYQPTRMNSHYPLSPASMDNRVKKTSRRLFFRHSESAEVGRRISF